MLRFAVSGLRVAKLRYVVLLGCDAGLIVWSFSRTLQLGEGRVSA